MTTTAPNGIPYITQVAVPEGFNPQEQFVIVYRSNGTAWAPVSWPTINAMYWSQYNMNFQYGTMFGLALMLLIMSLCLNPKEKLLTRYWGCAIASLLIIMARVIDQNFATSDTIWSSAFGYWFYEPDAHFVRTKDITPLMIGSILPMFLLITVWGCLIIQANVYLKVLHTFYRRCILAVLTIVYGIGAGFKIVYYICGAYQAIHPSTSNPPPWLIRTGTFFLAVSTGLFMLVFSWNSWKSIKTRNSAHMNHTSAMEAITDATKIVLFASVDSLVIPFIFSVMECFPNDVAVPDPSGLALYSVPLIVIFSSLWAGNTKRRGERKQEEQIEEARAYNERLTRGSQRLPSVAPIRRAGPPEGDIEMGQMTFADILDAPPPPEPKRNVPFGDGRFA